MMKKIVCLLTAIASFCVHAQNATEDYAQFSSLSPEELMAKGRECFESREPGKALYCFLSVADSQDQARETRDDLELRVRALNNAGCVYKYFYYDYPLSFEYFNRAYALAEQIDYQSFMPVVMVNLGDLLIDYGNTYGSAPIIKEAQSLFKDCYRIALKRKNWELLATAFYNLSTLNYDINLADYKDIFSKEIPDDTPDIQYVRLQYDGIRNIQQHRYAEAREDFRRQLENITTPWEPERDSVASLINIAETYRLEGNFADAAASLSEALRMAEKANIIDLAANIAHSLMDCYSQMGDETKYEQYYVEYLKKTEQLHQNHLSNIGEMKYVADLRREETRAQAIAVRNRLLRYVVLALVIVLLTILAAGWIVWRNNRELKRRNRSLFEKYNLLMEAEEAAQPQYKYTHSNLDDTKKEVLVESIRNVIEKSDSICSEDFSLKELARLVDSNTTYVSQVINEVYGVSFSNLLGTARVKRVCHIIKESNDFDNLTVEGIARMAGFKSRTAFHNAFKREVGLVPSQYIKMAVAERQKEA